MIHYNEFDLNPNIKEWESFVVDKLGQSAIPNEEMIWDTVKDYDSMPIFENIYQGLLINVIKRFIEGSSPFKVYSYLNCRDTHLSIDYGKGVEPFCSYDYDEQLNKIYCYE